MMTQKLHMKDEKVDLRNEVYVRFFQVAPQGQDGREGTAEATATVEITSRASLP